MKLSDSEWTVMNALWDKQSPASVRDVLEAVTPEIDWAYTTVKTVLTRLEEKGVVRSELDGKMKLFEPLVSQEKAQRTAVRGLIERAFGGAASGLFHHLVSEDRLPKRKQAELEKLIQQIREEESKKKGEQDR